MNPEQKNKGKSPDPPTIHSQRNELVSTVLVGGEDPL
jgi:hypothetical protein